MQATDSFVSIISAHLESVAQTDPLFAETYKKQNKNIKDCTTYILNEVQKSGRNGFADQEIFGMAVHYYDEDDLQPGKAINCKVVVNHAVELPKTSKAAAVPEAKKAVKKVAPVMAGPVNQTSLFG